MLVDHLLTGGLIRTMDPTRPTASWMAIHHGRVVAVGHSDKHPPPAEKTTDLAGHTVLPGFYDAHCHTMWFGLSLGEVDTKNFSTLDALYDALAERASGTPPGQWVRATGYNQEAFGGEYPDIQVLDRVLPDHPLMMRHTSGHACIVNSRALTLAGTRW